MGREASHRLLFCQPPQENLPPVGDELGLERIEPREIPLVGPPGRADDPARTNDAEHLGRGALPVRREGDTERR
jgi:hypothetical protein